MMMMGGCFVVPKILALSTVDSVIIHIIVRVDAGADAVKVEQWWRNRERWAGGIKVEKFLISICCICNKRLTKQTSVTRLNRGLQQQTATGGQRKTQETWASAEL